MKLVSLSRSMKTYIQHQVVHFRLNMTLRSIGIDTVIYCNIELLNEIVKKIQKKYRNIKRKRLMIRMKEIIKLSRTRLSTVLIHSILEFL